MAQGDETDLTRILSECGHREGALAELLPLVYDELRRIAQRRLSSERPDHTLQATALVHEAYLRLVGNADLHWSSRAHFFSAAAEAMRQILIDHARARGCQKRGGQRSRIPLDLVNVAEVVDLDTILTLDEAISRLEKDDPLAAKVVRLRFFAGLSGDETASVLGLSPSTVDRNWTYARACLFRRLKGTEAGS